MRRVLFVIPDLGRAHVYMPSVLAGETALSGSRSSWLYVLEGLAASEGSEVAGVVLSGDELTEAAASVFNSLDQALRWVGDGIVVYCSWGDWQGVPLLNSLGRRPWVWLHTYLDRRYLDALDKGLIEAILVPSDTSRMQGLRRSRASRLGRIYNPIGKLFLRKGTDDLDRYRSRQLVFSGAIVEHKGAHRILQAWTSIRNRSPGARLVLAGSPKLYSDSSTLGPLGVADAKFEVQHVAPLVEEFGSLEGAGVRFAGLLKPTELDSLYRSSAIGLANLNWHDNMETFGCSVAEMIGTGLPVVGFARGALPETAGLTGAASLVEVNDPSLLAERVAELVEDPERLAAMGASGAAYVAREYAPERAIARWKEALGRPPSRQAHASGPWRMPGRQFRRLVEASAGRLRCGWVLDAIQSVTCLLRSAR